MTRREFIDTLIKSAKDNADTDLSEVVRCKDCMYCAVIPAGGSMCSLWKDIIATNGFCYMGNKKDNNEEEYEQ